MLYIDFNGFWSRVTLFDITLLVIIAFLIVFLIIIAINNKKHHHLNPDEIKYYFISTIFNATICFIGFFVNELAFVNIFQIPGGLIVDGGVLIGIIAILIISLISVTGNIKIYRHWNPDGSYKSIKFWIPMCAYILFDLLLPLHRLFTWK